MLCYLNDVEDESTKKNYNNGFNDVYIYKYLEL